MHDLVSYAIWKSSGNMLNISTGLRIRGVRARTVGYDLHVPSFLLIVHDVGADAAAMVTSNAKNNHFCRFSAKLMRKTSHGHRFDNDRASGACRASISICRMHWNNRVSCGRAEATELLPDK